MIDERALRELYLVPFELAVREGGVFAVMTAYNRVNGDWVTERRDLLRDLVRDEWGFEGLVMTDWFGVADTVDSIAAGLDLEMPGPGEAYGPALAGAVRRERSTRPTSTPPVRRLLAAFDRDRRARDPDAASPPEPSTPDDVALMRRGRRREVLLHNDGTLPLDSRRLRHVAVIGPNARPLHHGRRLGGGHPLPRRVRSTRSAPLSAPTVM